MINQPAFSMVTVIEQTSERPAWGESDTLPAGFEIWFGSIHYQVTGNGYHMRILNREALKAAPPGTSAAPMPAVFPPPPRRHKRSGKRSRRARTAWRQAADAGSPQGVEAGELPPDGAEQGDTPPPTNSTAHPAEGAVAAQSRFPHGMRGATLAYSSSVGTDLAAYEDLPDRHFWSIRNLIATSPDDSYRDTDGEEYGYGRGAPEWDYSGLRDPDAFRQFQSTARGITIPPVNASLSSSARAKAR